MESLHDANVGAPELYVTSFHRRVTGVSTTAAAVVSRQQQLFAMRVIGTTLPHGPVAISYRAALRETRRRPTDRPFAIWHVRRNMEMEAAIVARDILRLPIKIVFTSAAQRYHSLFPRILISRMDAVVATTDKAARFVPHLAAVVPHGVDVGRFQPAADRAAEWRAAGWPGQLGIGIVGRIRAEKGTDLFVDAMLRVLPQRPEFTAVVIGQAKASDHAFERELRAKIRAANLERQFVFLGEVKPDEMPGIMRRLSLVVAPARYEGYGMTPLEAMASGVAVVASDTGAYADMIENNVTGNVVAIDDLHGLTAAILQITADPQRLHECGLRGRERAVARFSLENEVNGLSRVYERLWSGETF